MYGLKQIESEKENLKDILEVVKDELKIKPAYVKRAAQELFKEELGKLNRSEKNDDDAAVEQCREIYCERETGVGAHYADEPDDDYYTKFYYGLTIFYILLQLSYNKLYHHGKILC